MIRGPAVALVSAAVLGYEVLLVRLFAITQWHHFASMAIGIALLGFGVSGALLAVLRDRLRRRTAAAFAAAAVLLAATSTAAVIVAQRLPFNALAIGSHRRVLNSRGANGDLFIPRGALKILYHVHNDLGHRHCIEL